VVVGGGVISYVEPSALGWESGSVRVERTGAVTLVMPLTSEKIWRAMRQAP
jgi:hypothetical protein